MLKDTLFNAVSTFFDFVDHRQIIRRVVFIWVLWLTSEVVHWTMGYASNSPRPGMEVAAIIGAVWAPMTFLLGSIFKFYDSSQQSRIYQQRRKYQRRQDADTQGIPTTRVINRSVVTETN